MTIIAIDVGSSSVRALMFAHDANGVQPIRGASPQRHYTFDTDAAGRATVDAAHLRELVEACLDDVLAHPAAESIDAVSMATFAGNWLAVDADTADPRSPLITYADSRSAATIDDLRPHIDSDATLQRTGTRLHPAYAPAQVNHLGLPADAQLLDFGAYCYRVWFGREIPMSYAMAAWSGLLDRQALTWDDTWLDILSLSREQLPALADYSQAQHSLSDDYASRWHVLDNVPFYLAVGDGAAAQVGSGAVERSTAALTIGTTAALRQVIAVNNDDAVPQVPAGGWAYRMDAAHHLLGGALSEGGNVYAWLRQTFDLDADALDTALRERAPASHGLTALPMLAGERSPGWQPHAAATLHGLHMNSTPLDMAHALLESVALRLAWMQSQLALPDETRIMASGGALRASSGWTQLIADALGQSLHVLDTPEVTALGTAHLAWCALREISLTGANPTIANVVQPRSERTVQLHDALAAQQALYNQLYSSSGR